MIQTFLKQVADVGRQYLITSLLIFKSYSEALDTLLDMSKFLLMVSRYCAELASRQASNVWCWKKFCQILAFP